MQPYRINLILLHWEQCGLWRCLKVQSLELISFVLFCFVLVWFVLFYKKLTVSPALGRWKYPDPWDRMISQPSLLCESQARERPYLQKQRNDVQGHSVVYIYMQSSTYVCTHICTQIHACLPAQAHTHTNIWRAMYDTENVAVVEKKLC